MFRNYFRITLRVVMRNKVYALINSAGLAISMATCLFLYVVIRFELSFNSFHAQSESIFRVVMDYQYEDGDIHTPGVPAPAPEAFRADFPQLKNVATLFSVPNCQIDVLSYEGKQESRYREERGVIFAEPQFFQIFDFEWMQGSAKSCLREPNSVALTQETAEKYFGTWQNAIGKQIEYNNQAILQVNGILKNFPANSDFPFTVIISFTTRKEPNMNWGDVTSRRQLYVQVPEHTNENQIRRLIPNFEKKHLGNLVPNARFRLQPIKEMHFDNRYNTLAGRTISKVTLLSLGAIGVFLLITASINFINLAVAQALRRSKEVGIRKSLGSLRSQLVFQFLGEAFFIVLSSACWSIILYYALLPYLKPLLNIPESVDPIHPLELTVFALILIFLMTILSALYPSIVMAKFKAIQALKSKITNQMAGGGSIRKSLVITQFVIAQILIMAALVIFLQMRFFQQKELGFDKDLVIYFNLPAEGREQLEPLRNAILYDAGVADVSCSFAAPSWSSNQTGNFSFDKSTKNEPFEVNQKFADTNFLKLYNIPIVAGRMYQFSDTSREYVVNETFLRKCGINDLNEGLGKGITIGNKTLPIVGIMRDFHLRSLHSAIEPLIISSDRSQLKIVNIKLRAGVVSTTIERISKIYTSYFPENIFEFSFLDDQLAQRYRHEQRLSSLTIIFCSIALAISALGLYGLVSFMTAQRTKEIGIRKVLGATVNDIVALFGKELLLMLFFSFLVAAPVSAYTMKRWLTQFAYHIDLSWFLFAASILGTLMVALLSVSYQSIKAARSNPVKSLRME